MNIKPTSEQCQVWSSQAESFAINISSQGRHGGKGFAELFNTKFAELAAQWGASQAQQTTVEEPELPEAAKCEGGWGEPCVYYYTSRQMHDHYAAGVRAGAVGSQDAKLRNGFVLVPLVMSWAMEEVVQQEDWEWADLLAAAEAVTEEQYNAAMKEQQ